MNYLILRHLLKTHLFHLACLAHLASKIAKSAKITPNFIPTNNEMWILRNADFNFDRYHSIQAERFPLKSGSLQGSTVLDADIQLSVQETKYFQM